MPLECGTIDQTKRTWKIAVITRIDKGNFKLFIFV